MKYYEKKKAETFASFIWNFQVRKTKIIEKIPQNTWNGATVDLNSVVEAENIDINNERIDLEEERQEIDEKSELYIHKRGSKMVFMSLIAISRNVNAFRLFFVQKNRKWTE